METVWSDREQCASRGETGVQSRSGDTSNQQLFVGRFSGCEKFARVSPLGGVMIQRSGGLTLP